MIIYLYNIISEVTFLRDTFTLNLMIILLINSVYYYNI